MDKKNKSKQGGVRSKGLREQLSSLPSPSSSQNFLTLPLDLSGQPYDVSGLQHALSTDLGHLAPTANATGYGLHSGFASNDVSLDSVLSANMDFDLNSYPNLDFDLESYILEEESNTSQESLESERWTPRDDWSLEGQVTYPRDQYGPMGGTVMGANPSAVLPGTSEQFGGVVGITPGLLSPSALPESSEQYGAVGGTTLDNLTSAVLPGTTNHLNFQVSCLHRHSLSTSFNYNTNIMHSLYCFSYVKLCEN